MDKNSLSFWIVGILAVFGISSIVYAATLLGRAPSDPGPGATGTPSAGPTASVGAPSGTTEASPGADVTEPAASPTEVAAATAAPTPVKEGTVMRSLISDPLWQNGFKVQGLDPTAGGTAVSGLFDYDGDDAKASTDPVWTLAQWFSGHDFALESHFTKLGTGLFRYDDATKRVTVDTVKGRIGLALNASKYYTAPRLNGEPWPHLLISIPGTHLGTKYKKIDAMEALQVKFSARLTAFSDAMGDTADPGLHACAFYVYLYIQDLGVDSAGRGEMIWFGLPVFDNRNEWLPEYAAADGGKKDASGMFIYQIPQKAYLPRPLWKDGKPDASPGSEFVTVDTDVLPYVRRAFDLAKSRGFLADTTWDELYFNGLNIGWEMFGTYDAEIEVQGFDVLASSRS